MSENFVIAHIDSGYRSDGADVLKNSGAEPAFKGGVPFIYSINDQGQFVAVFDSDQAEVRRDTDDPYRGYDRNLMRANLEKLREAAKAMP